jgi:hypothetical protein
LYFCALKYFLIVVFVRHLFTFEQSIAPYQVQVNGINSSESGKMHPMHTLRSGVPGKGHQTDPQPGVS